MTIEKTNGTPPSRAMANLSRLGRVSVFFMSAGFAFPNVFVENLDVTKIDAKNRAQNVKV